VVWLEPEVSALRTASVLPVDAQIQSTVSPLKEYVGSRPSLIVWDFPKLFEDFKKMRFARLWRGSRDSFRARGFHSPSDAQVKNNNDPHFRA
jgi:hypothetical protein